MWFGIYRYRQVQRKVNLLRHSVEGDKPIV
jgi:hypothetical protein